MNSRGFVFAILAIAIIASSIGTVSAYTYNHQGAVNYAQTNAYNDVPGSAYFRNHGGDCTNFISQSLYNGGGMRQVVNNQNQALSWFYNGYYAGQYSESWAGVQPFRNFMVSSGRATEVSFAAGTYYLPGTSPIQTGDVIQADWTGDGTWDHTMIITQMFIVQGFKMFKVTYHSYDRRDKPLVELINENPNIRFRALILKNTYSY